MSLTTHDSTSEVQVYHHYCLHCLSNLLPSPFSLSLSLLNLPAIGPIPSLPSPLDQGEESPCGKLSTSLLSWRGNGIGVPEVTSQLLGDYNRYNTSSFTLTFSLSDRPIVNPKLLLIFTCNYCRPSRDSL